MKELADKISVKMVEFEKNIHDNVKLGNKAAGVRARKASLELEKLLKEYRKQSIEAAK